MTATPTHFKYECRICHSDRLQAIVVDAPSETPIPVCCGRSRDMAYKGVHVQIEKGLADTPGEDREQSTFGPSTKAIWTSTAAASKGPVEVLILGPADESTYDRHDVGPMYDIQLPDGSEECAFEDELVAGSSAFKFGTEASAPEKVQP
ncbi:hypothetical protein [Pseudomonas asiatica]|uniref:hypothetical protein n=1 Tax=Pseudomonas asiatica TaxID=2219225 RepID=UPI0010BFC8F9|nr:hypothetical protein [Pseudomonas asiatica]EKT4528325.1 hypothetical protein [Pseudomonas putida]